MVKKVFRVILPIVCTIGVICTIGIIGLGGCVSEKQESENAKKYILRNLEIEIPDDAIFIYRYFDNSFGNGRKEQLAVFEFENEPTAWLEENKFLRSDDETLVDDEGKYLVNKNIGSFLSYFKIDMIEQKGIPKEYVPNFKVPFLWVDRGIYTSNLFYYPDTMRLIVYVAWS